MSRPKTKIKSKRISVNRDIISAEELLGPISIPPYVEPKFVNDGSGNGWYVYPDGTWSYVYFR